MGRKHNLTLNLLQGISADMSASITSREIDSSELDKASINASWAAGPAGAFTVEVIRNDKDSWVALDTGTPWSIVASDDSAQIILTEMPFIKLRLVWTPTSGSGTLVAYMNLKTVGA
jgi:hypothetical protein